LTWRATSARGITPDKQRNSTQAHFSAVFSSYRQSNGCALFNIAHLKHGVGAGASP
jgi:hypothetical protein